MPSELVELTNVGMDVEGAHVISVSVRATGASSLFPASVQQVLR
jgi:hypothetical protein